MEISKVIRKRKAFRELEKISISQPLIEDLIESARLAPSCFNNQPWHYIFVTSEEKLEELKSAYSKGNTWCEEASMVIVVVSRKEDDCQIKDREYYLYDSGISAGFIMLKATELDLIAHPIAGYSQKKVKRIFEIPEDFQVINLIILGKHKQNSQEKRERDRKPVSENFHINRFGKME